MQHWIGAGARVVALVMAPVAVIAALTTLVRARMTVAVTTAGCMMTAGEAAMTVADMSGAAAIEVMNAMSSIEHSVPAMRAAAIVNAVTAAVLSGMAVVSEMSHHQSEDDEAPTEYGAHQIGLA